MLDINIFLMQESQSIFDPNTAVKLLAEVGRGEYIYTWNPLECEKYAGVENNETLLNPNKIISVKTNDLLQPNKINSPAAPIGGTSVL